MKPEFLTSGDISLLTKVEALGGVFRDGGQPRNLLKIFDLCNKNVTGHATHEESDALSCSRILPSNIERFGYHAISSYARHPAIAL